MKSRLLYKEDFDMRKSVPKLIALIGCLLCLFFSSASAEEPIRIMPLGDSITRGWYGSPGANGYRKPLYLNLTNHSYNVDFVGCQNDGDFADRNHEGRDGWHAAGGPNGNNILPNVYNWLTAHPADIVLLHIGTNDISVGGQDANEVNDILDEIDRYNPDITVVLALIINRKSYNSITTQYNNSLNQMAMNRIANGDDIIIVNMENALNYSTDMADNLHPNDSGYAKMANVWFAALDNLLKWTPPTIVSTPATTAVVQQPYTYDVNTCGYPDPNCELIEHPDGMTIDANTDIIEWTPTTTGDFDVIVKASNGLIPDANQTFTISVSPIVEFDSASSANAQDSNTLSWSHTIGSGDNRILVVGTAGKDTGSADLEISSVRYNNVPMNLVEGSARAAGSDPHVKTELYYLLEESLPSPGSYNVVITYDGSVAEACGGAVSLKNVGQGPPEDVATNAQSGSNSISTDIVALTNYAYVVDVVGSDTPGTLDTAAEDMIRRWHQAATGSSAAMSTRAVAAAGTVTNSWSHTAVGQLVQSAVTLPPAGRIISGYIQEPNKIPISGVLVSVEGSISNDVTGPDGFYQILVPYGWSGTVTPTKTDCVFRPAPKTYDDVIANQVNQNYTNIKTYDLDCDGSIGFGDLRIISENLLQTGENLPGDFYKDEDDTVNFLDFADFANVWKD